jgi:hypothetical protein
VPDALFGSPPFWLAGLAALALTAGSRFASRCAANLFRPGPFARLDRAAARARSAAAQRAREAKAAQAAGWQGWWGRRVHG